MRKRGYRTAMKRRNEQNNKELRTSERTIEQINEQSN